MLSFYKTTMVAVLAALPILTWASEPKKHTSLRNIKAVKTDTTLTLLDRVESDIYRKEYQYNDYGYITSVKVYNKDVDWNLDTMESYEQTYSFDDNGQCTERVRYSLKENGQRDEIIDKAAIVKEGDYTWERYWDTASNGETYLSEAIGYDKWGNRAIEIEYKYDDYEHKSYVYRYSENRFLGKLPAEDHYEYSNYKNALCTYSLYYTGWGSGTISSCDGRKVVDEISGGVLERKTYILYDMYGALIEDIDNHWVLEGTERYTLNANDTRPTSRLVDGVVTHTWQWDDKGRLIKYTEDSNDKHSQSYTYVDDYAAELSLQQAIAEVGGFYPEEADCIYGHVATYHSEDIYGYEDQTAEYNDKGQVVKVTYTEVDTDDHSTIRGNMIMGYCADGHRAYMIDACPDEDSYTKEEYIYNRRGVWTGIIEYEGDSENGPWRKTHTSGQAAKRRGMRKQPAKALNLTEDMSDGWHSIYASEGFWGYDGSYTVENGEITQGSYRTYPMSDAHCPQDPELNYTDPRMPLQGEDDEDSGIEWVEGWYYQWNTDSRQWELYSAPNRYDRTYKDGDLIKTDSYNKDKEITRTEVFTFDDAGRLIKDEWNDSDPMYYSGYYEYTYLGDTNYLSTSYFSRYNEMRRYYYSKRGYADPTGIDNATIKPNAGDAFYYDLQGRRILNPRKGIYIHQGKKVVIK